MRIYSDGKVEHEIQSLEKESGWVANHIQSLY